MCGPLHLYFSELLDDLAIPEIVEDNARAHENEEPVQCPEMRRALSTGSIGSSFASRWDTGTSCVEAPKISCCLVNPEVFDYEDFGDDDDVDLNMEDFKWLTSLSRANSTGSLDEKASARALSRWDSSSAVPNFKKDGAIKKPLRKNLASKDEFEHSSASPQSIKDVTSYSSLDDRPLSKPFEIPTELFRTH